jgi:[ribosomal protein S5]-alanine N-acetyltransferase
MSPARSLMLSTARLNLRPLRTSDGGALAKILRDPRVGRTLPYRVRTEGGEAFVARVQQEQRAGTNFAFAIVPKGLAEPIGQVRLMDWNRRDRHAEIGLFIGRRWWGKGFGPEAIRAVCDFGFGSLGLHRVDAWVVEGNTRSVQALRKCGFQVEGLRREATRVNRRWYDVVLLGAVRRTARRASARRWGSAAA